MKKLSLILLFLFLTANCFGATFGETGSGGSGILLSRGLFASKYTLSVGGTVQSLYAKLSLYQSNSINYAYAIYSNDNNQPSALLDYTDIGTISIAHPSSTILNLTSSIDLNAGDYWLAYRVTYSNDSPTFYLYFQSGNGSPLADTLGQYSSFPQTFPSSSPGGTDGLCIYATYTPIPTTFKQGEEIFY